MRTCYLVVSCFLIHASQAVICREKLSYLAKTFQGPDYETKTCTGNYCSFFGKIGGNFTTPVMKPIVQSCSAGPHIETNRCWRVDWQMAFCLCNSDNCSDAEQFFRKKGNQGKVLINVYSSPNPQPSQATNRHCEKELGRYRINQRNAYGYFQGDLCYVQRPNGGGLQLRGCITNNETLFAGLYQVGYLKMQSFEYTLCNTTLCNIDWKTAVGSLSGVPPSSTSSSNSTIPSVNEAIFESEYLKLFTNIKSAVDSFIAMISTKHTIYQARLIRSYLNKEIDQKTYYSRYNIDLEIEAHSRAMFGGSFEDVFVEECRRLGLPPTASRRQLPGIAAASLATSDGMQLKRSSPKDTSPVPEKKKRLDSPPALSPKELKKEEKESNDEETPQEDQKKEDKVKLEKKRRTYEEEREKAMRKKKVFPTALPPRELKKLISGSERRDMIRNSLREMKSQEKMKLDTSPNSQEKKKKEITPPLPKEKKNQEDTILPPAIIVESIVSTPKLPRKEEFTLRRQEMKKNEKTQSPSSQATMDASSPIVTTPKRNRGFSMRRLKKKTKNPFRLSLVPKPQGALSPVRRHDASPATTEDTVQIGVKDDEIQVPPHVEESEIEDNQPLEDASSPALDDSKEETPSPLSEEIIEQELARDTMEEENEEIHATEESTESPDTQLTHLIEEEISLTKDLVEYMEQEPVISPSEVQENEDLSPSQLPTEYAQPDLIPPVSPKKIDAPSPVLVESIEQEPSEEAPMIAVPQPDISSPILQEKPETAPVTAVEEIMPTTETKMRDPLARACSICLCKAPRERVFYTDCGHVSCRACAELILFEQGFSPSSIRNPQIPCPFCRKTSGIAPLNEDHTFPEETEEMGKKSARDELVEFSMREQRIQRFLNGKISQKQYVDSYNKWMKITADRHEKKGGGADEIFNAELKRIQEILPHVKDNANLALGAAEVTWLDEKERLISRLKRENDALSKLKFADPHRTQYSSTCTNCQEEDSRKKFAFISCGHVICQECLEKNDGNKRKPSCKQCKKPSKAVRIFEHEVRPRR